MALNCRLPNVLRLVGIRCMSGMGEWGSGAGKGGGTGGSVRDAGGAFGKMEAAHEELYFKKLERDQLAKLRRHLEEEVEYHEDQIEEHKEAIERHKRKIQVLQRDELETSRKDQ
ncbi:ATPase inhibitor mai-2, mitochondrial-like isoform X1 [Pomacea canaliculata]|uniref:ATPase inhibitor mai-2, mitochondrial-like isoform X1 n=1 Tax=Pomacea canaliculata TaxID=400727 RepID=UPI000D73A776|nr:ATPase inhibitor mai-2, mitochondrial-like isoform X1 [Pomacea canaliculata]